MTKCQIQFHDEPTLRPDDYCYHCTKDKIAELQTKLETARYALLSNGYKEHCDIMACNCGDQWNHGGHAMDRLNEIDEALPYENGSTILKRVQKLVDRLPEVTNE